MEEKKLKSRNLTLNVSRREVISYGNVPGYLAGAEPPSAFFGRPSRPSEPRRVRPRVWGARSCSREIGLARKGASRGCPRARARGPPSVASPLSPVARSPLSPQSKSALNTQRHTKEDVHAVILIRLTLQNMYW